MYSYTKIEIEKLLCDSKTEKPHFTNIVTVLFIVLQKFINVLTHYSWLDKSINNFNGVFVCFWHDSLQWARPSSFTRFLDHTQRRTTVGRTLWKSDQPVAETSTWQHTTDKHPCPRWDSNPQSQQARASADLRLRLRGHWNCLLWRIIF